jgi:hypothetical protein
MNLVPEMQNIPLLMNALDDFCGEALRHGLAVLSAQKEFPRVKTVELKITINQNRIYFFEKAQRNNNIDN